jgi:hypothetical protein
MSSQSNQFSYRSILLFSLEYHYSSYRFRLPYRKYRKAILIYDHVIH